MMLNTDIELFYDVKHVDENGRTGCTLPGSSMDLTVCERYSSYDIGEIYAQVGTDIIWVSCRESKNELIKFQNKDLFIADFGVVLDKMLLNKVDLSKVKDLKMKIWMIN